MVGKFVITRNFHLLGKSLQFLFSVFRNLLLVLAQQPLVSVFKTVPRIILVIIFMSTEVL